MPSRPDLLVGVLVVALATPGCRGRCGWVDYQTGLEWGIPGSGDPPESVDGYRLHEICGDLMGTFGDEDLLDDGVGWLEIDGSHPNSHVAITLTSGMVLDVSFATDSLQVGHSLEIVGSYAAMLSNGSYLSGAPFTEGSIEVLDADDEIDPIYDTRRWRLRWDMVWGEPGVSEYWYTATGEDWVHMYVDGTP